MIYFLGELEDEFGSKVQKQLEKSQRLGRKMERRVEFKRDPKKFGKTQGNRLEIYQHAYLGTLAY